MQLTAKKWERHTLNIYLSCTPLLLHLLLLLDKGPRRYLIACHANATTGWEMQSTRRGSAKGPPFQRKYSAAAVKEEVI